MSVLVTYCIVLQLSCHLVWRTHALYNISTIHTVYTLHDLAEHVAVGVGCYCGEAFQAEQGFWV